jgi:hypothetical protein
MADPMDEAKREAEAKAADDRFSKLTGPGVPPEQPRQRSDGTS